MPSLLEGELRSISSREKYISEEETDEEMELFVEDDADEEVETEQGSSDLKAVPIDGQGVSVGIIDRQGASTGL
mgnify:CR=1 FL=1